LGLLQKIQAVTFGVFVTRGTICACLFCGCKIPCFPEARASFRRRRTYESEKIGLAASVTVGLMDNLVARRASCPLNFILYPCRILFVIFQHCTTLKTKKASDFAFFSNCFYPARDDTAT